MDAIIKQAVREELRRQTDEKNGETGENGETERVAPSTRASTSTSTQRAPRTQRTVTRLSGLLNRIRHGSNGPATKKKGRVDRERRIQIRWIHYSIFSRRFEQVRLKNGGGNRFIAYSDAEPLDHKDIIEKASALFFPDGKSNFAGCIEDMSLFICDTTQTAIMDFPGDGTIASYLTENGLYSSTTYLYLRSQPKTSLMDEFEDEPASDEDPLVKDSEVRMPVTAPDSRIVCTVCGRTYLLGEQCLMCLQDKEYEQSVFADTVNRSSELASNTAAPETPEESLTLDEMRVKRIVFLSAAGSGAEGGHEEDEPAREETSTCTSTSSLIESLGPSSSPTTETIRLTVRRSHIKADLITHFKNPDVINSDITFEMKNDAGKFETGVGIGVTREVYTLFWEEFSISMTIGERERVPYVRHDHFVEEWEAIGRILIKGYESVSYYPFFLSKAFMCYCLFGNHVSDIIFLNSLKRYLSPDEEDLVEDVLKRNGLPDDREEFDEFLERFKCRTFVTKDNVVKVLLEIAKQELVQKPHLMAAAWQPIFQNRLKNHTPFQSISSVENLYETIKPTTKKVLNNLISNPETEGERDAFKFLQRFIRGLDNVKLVQFLRFTTAMDIMGTRELMVTFLKVEGFSSRPIAHTCAPVLEIPSTYSNFVELREQFTNILNQNSWEMDIM